NPNLMVLRDAKASVLSDRVFVQTAKLAQPKFKSGVACSLHFSEPVPNRNKEFTSLMQYRHARNRLSFTPMWPRASIRSWHARAKQIAARMRKIRNNKKAGVRSDRTAGLQRIGSVDDGRGCGCNRGRRRARRTCRCHRNR